MKRRFAYWFIFIIGIIITACGLDEYWYRTVSYMHPTGIIITNSFTAQFTTEVELVEERGDRYSVCFDCGDCLYRNDEMLDSWWIPGAPPWGMGETWNIWLDEYTNEYWACSGGTNRVTFIRTNGPEYIPFSKLYEWWYFWGVDLILDFSDTSLPDDCGTIPFIYGDFFVKHSFGNDAYIYIDFSWDQCVQGGINQQGNGFLNLSYLDTNFYTYSLSRLFRLEFSITIFFSALLHE